ncbi:MAG: recombinase family protein [Clostridiales bacterium]|nr:recombinase family protein [Clostridiales bacterium]
MARKSRKAEQQARARGIIPDSPSSPEPSLPVRYRTGLYARLSVYNMGRDDSDSIQNQTRLLEDYVSRHPDLVITDVYIDNGRTGTNFQRPEFDRMIEDVKNGRLQALVVKDLSRFGRNYLEAGFYLQKIFPFLGIRFISITDGYDSLTSDPDSLAVSMKNIINDYYSKDISRKVSSSFDLKRSTGPFIMGNVPYGYLRDPEDSGHYIIDEETAPYVHLIFQWAMAGIPAAQIAAALTDMGAPTQQRCVWIRSKRNTRRKGSDNWNDVSVRDILLNRTYTGDYLCEKKRNRMYDPSGNYKREEPEWKVYPNNHPSYISKEDFAWLKDRFQVRLEGRKSSLYSNLPKPPEPLHGLVYCGLCGRKMKLRRSVREGFLINSSYYCTGTANQNREGHERFLISVSETEMAVQWQIGLQIRLALDTEELLRRFSNGETTAKLKATRQAEIQMLKTKAAAARSGRAQAFEDLASALIDEDTYHLRMEKLAGEISSLEEQIRQTQQHRDEVDTHFSLNNKWLRTFADARYCADDGGELAHQLIQKIEIFPDKVIRVTFQYNDWMEPLLAQLQEAQADTMQAGNSA